MFDTVPGKIAMINQTIQQVLGTVVENVNFSAVKSCSDEARYYCCAWYGSKSRETIPGRWDGIPNKLGR